MFYILTENTFSYIDERIDYLTKKCVNELLSQGFDIDDIKTTPFLNLRYDRTDCALMCIADMTTNNVGVTCRHGNFMASFNARYVIYIVYVSLLIYSFEDINRSLDLQYPLVQ